MNKERCPWCEGSEMMREYHDREWGVPVHDDRHFFEMLILEGAQAGLSWSTVLKRRASYREAFANFDPQKVARFDDAKAAELLLNPGIIRNRAKIAATIAGARAFLAVQKEFGSFDTYVWRFVGGAPLPPKRQAMGEVPANSPESDALSRDLKKRGFNFVGTTIVYAFMQATGLVNDHLVSCYRAREVGPQ